MTDEEKAALAAGKAAGNKDEDGDEVEDAADSKPSGKADDSKTTGKATGKAAEEGDEPAAEAEEPDADDESGEPVEKGASVGVIEAGELFSFLREMSGEESRKSAELVLDTLDNRVEDALIKALGTDAVKGAIRRIVGGRLQDGFAAQNEALGEKLTAMEKGLTGMTLLAKGAALDPDALARSQAAASGTAVASEVISDDVLAKGAPAGAEATMGVLQKGALLIEKGLTLQRDKRVVVDGLADAISERGAGEYSEATLKKLESGIASAAA